MPEGSVFVTSDFENIAVDDTVSKILARLSEDDTVERVLRGVYWKPEKMNGEYGKSDEPYPDNVAKALARNNSQRVVPCGDTALHILGLSEDDPKEWTYITDGAYQEYTYENVCIKFKHATGKLFETMSDKTATVVQAIKAYGKEHLTKEKLLGLLSKLSNDDLDHMLFEAKYTTAWIYKAIKKMCRLSENKEQAKGELWKQNF